MKDPKPPGPHEIIVSPNHTSIMPGGEVGFTAIGLSKQGLEVKIDRLEWFAAGGNIDSLGVFKAGTSQGTFSVEAIAGSVKGSARVTIMAASMGQELDRLIVSPQNMHIAPGKTQLFTAKGLNKEGLEVPLGKINWSSTGGEIDGNGFFLAGQDEGNFEITAIVGDTKSSAPIRIGWLSPHWNGEIPHQKWTQFYNRILSKFAVRKGLKLNVSVDILDASEEEIKEMKAALRELGLVDVVTF